MAPDDDLLRIVEDIYSAALEPGRWVGVLERIADFVAAQHAHLFIADSHTMIPAFAAVGRQMSEDLLREFHAHYQAIDPRIEAGLRLPAKVFYPDPALCEPRAFERSEFYNDFYRRCGSRWMAGAMLERTAEVTTGFAVVRTPKQGPFEDEDIRTLQLVQPHVTIAARMQRRLAERAEAVTINLEALDRLATGVVVLNSQGQTVLANRAARRMAASGDGLCLGPEGLTALNGGPTVSLQKALAAALRHIHDRSSFAPQVVAVQRPSMRRPYEILMAPVPGQDSAWGLTGAGIVILLTDPEDIPEPPVELLARLYGLTRAEASVGAALAVGQTLKEIADAAGYTREAARWHLKQIFQKTGVRRQAALVKLLRSGPLGMARLDDHPDNFGR